MDTRDTLQEEGKIKEIEKTGAGGPDLVSTENPMIKKRWFGRGIYGSRDVPIRLLDGFIAVVIVIILALIIFFAVNGGFYVTFDTAGGSQVDSQKLRHGSLIAEPEVPSKPGYTFAGWRLPGNEAADWNFAVDKVDGDLTLVAKWTPAQITVKFDLNGGSVDGGEEAGPLTVTFGEPYGELPVPAKEGAEFAGWRYSGSEITPETKVAMTGEHVLTAEWK